MPEFEFWGTEDGGHHFSRAALSAIVNGSEGEEGWAGGHLAGAAASSNFKLPCPLILVASSWPAALILSPRVC